ncbi:MAG TPA: hypothetical protein PK048_01265 [Candidatus Absconditabacterales bacterium]|nr:hypothetical protein [Candidatus Absconditabacterales bacterium]
MKLFSKKQLYNTGHTHHYSYHKEFDSGLIIKSEILFDHGEYVQYQENLIKDMIEQLESEASSPRFSVIKFKSYFELALQELNSKLAVFADKLRLFSKIKVKGMIEFFMDNYYVSSLIGDGSLIIFRKGQLYYALHNDATINKKIDLFAELIEGDLTSGDEILYFANNMSYFTDSEDFAYIGEINGTNDRTLIDIIEDMLSDRTSMETIGMINLDFIKLDSHFVPSSIKAKGFDHYRDRLHYRFAKRKYILSIAGFTGLMLLLAGLLIANFVQNKSGIQLSTTDGQSQDYFSLAGLKSEIDEFKALDPSAPEKYNMFKNLQNKIEQLEKDGKLPLDISQLKNMLQSEYQAGFNIEKIDQLDDRTISFNSNDLLDIGTPLQLFANKQLSIAGSAGVIIGVTNNELRGTIQKLGLDTKINGCTTNLQSNGLLCFDNTNTIYNLTKQSIQTANVGSGLFEKTIKQLGTFGNSNLYLLVDNPVLNGVGTFVLRYPLVPGSKESFKSPINYSFSDAAPGSVSNMSIDGTFLLWAPKDQSLYQLRRDGTTSKSRKINLQGGKELYEVNGTQTSSVKVYTNINTSLVYLYEPIKKILLVYKSTPPKTSDASKYTYNLKYFFALQLPSHTEIYDVAISDSSKPQLYVLTPQGVANIKLYDYIESFETIEKSNQIINTNNNSQPQG